MDALQALNLVGGSWQGAGSRRQGDSVDPATGLEIGSFAASARADAQQAIGAARAAFERGDWSGNPALRRRLLLEWADRLARRDDLALLLTRENGKVLAQARREIGAAVDQLRRCAAWTAGPGLPGQLVLPAAGVAAIIVPWRAPVGMLVAALAPALAAGCTAVIKPAPQVAQVVAAAIGELHRLAGLPAGVVNLVSESGHEVARELAASSLVDLIRFSGSPQTGKKVALAAAPSQKRVLLDLPGKSCCVVLGDADIERIAPRLAQAAIIGAGQQCSAARRILVHASRYEQTRAALTRALGGIVVGAGDAPGCAMGPLIDAAALLSVGIRTEQLLERCGEVLLRGARLGGRLANGYFLSPTLAAQGDDGAGFEEDIFGPLVVLGRFGDDGEAVAAANLAPGAASASVWSADPARALRVAAALRQRTVWINDHGQVDGAAQAGAEVRRGGYGVLDYLQTGPTSDCNGARPA